MKPESTNLSLHAPFHSVSLPQGFLNLIKGILPLLLGVAMSTYLILVTL